MTRRKQTRAIIALLITLFVHGALGGGLYAAGQLIDRNPERDKPIEVEIVSVVPKLPPPPPPLPEPEPEPEPEPLEPEPEPKPEPKVKPQPAKVKPAAEPPPSEPPPASNSTQEPAPGQATNSDAPAPVIQLPNLTPGGSGPPAAVGRPTSRRVGTGGTGTNTGGGGTSTEGTGGPRPVSVAAIKKQAVPLNADLEVGKLYPAEAKRLGIEGTVKVRLVVDETGKVISQRLITPLGHGLDELALKLSTMLRFEPAIDTTDKPVQSVVVWTFEFVLPK